VQAQRTTIERVALLHCSPSSDTSNPLAIAGSDRLLLRYVFVYGKAWGIWCGASTILDNTAIRGRVNCNGRLVINNSFVLGELGGPGPVEMRTCTAAGIVNLAGEPNAFVDSIVGQLVLEKANSQVESCDLYLKPPFAGAARLGKRCITLDPQFVDPARLDYRLKPTSPCRKRASDGGDIGCRFEGEMKEVLEKAMELVRKKIIEL
jgi:hypothetical protein